MRREIIIIGSGLGGLTIGYLLAKQGDRVTILEHDKHLGGCLQSFCRDGIRFDTGFHFVGGLTEGGPLFRFFKDLNLIDLPWKRLEGQEIWIGNQCFKLPAGTDNWSKYLIERFPHQERNIKEFVRVCKEVVECPFEQTMPYWEKNAWEWLCETIDDPLLRDVLSGASLIIELNRETLPLFAYAEIVYSYLYSSHRLLEGGQPIINRLTEYIQSCGGEIHCDSTVTRILEMDGTVTGVEVKDGTKIKADLVVSAIHPAETMNLLGEHSSMRRIYRQRLGKLTNSMGCFTANIKLKPGTVDMQDMATYVHRGGKDLWDYGTLPIDHILIHFYPEQNAMDFISPLKWDYFAQWEGTAVGHRGEDYEQFKVELLNQCIELAETVIPNLRNVIEQTWTSTPLTWQNYLLAQHGTAYGVRKDCRSPETTLLMPRTPLNGLYLAGQSIILHGIMGTTISSFITAEFLK